MRKKNDKAANAATIVQGEILPVIKLDFSEWVTPGKNWTRGPLLPENAVRAAKKNGKRPAKPRKKRS
jgi:hypothetical protein